MVAREFMIETEGEYLVILNVRRLKGSESNISNYWDEIYKEVSEEYNAASGGGQHALDSCDLERDRASKGDKYTANRPDMGSKGEECM
eukprot:8846156-Ditylum_brightwellii.AAC.1